MVYRWSPGDRKVHPLDFNKLADIVEDLDIKSEPPDGMKRITNIYWDPVTEEIVIHYEP